MAILTVVSTNSSPGVTSLAVGLALFWPRSVIVVDADPGAHQSVLAGFLAGQGAEGKGLLRVAEAHRDRRALTDVIFDQTLDLTATGADTQSRRFLPGFTRPGSAGLFAPVWPEFAGACQQLEASGFDVIVDAGRMGTAGLPGSLLDQARLTCVVLRSNLRSIMSARVHLPTLRDQAHAQAAEDSLGLIVVGGADPYGKTEVARALGLPVVASIADDPAHASYLSDGRAKPRKFDSSALARSLHNAASDLSGKLSHSVSSLAG